jgi:hypothetical protein
MAISTDEFVRTLKSCRFKCHKCGDYVTEYENIGQWNCFHVQYHTLTGKPFKVPSDHGTYDKNYYVISAAKAMALPKFAAGAFTAYKITDAKGNRVFQVKIFRRQEEKNMYRHGMFLS